MSRTLAETNTKHTQLVRRTVSSASPTGMHVIARPLCSVTALASLSSMCELSTEAISYGAGAAELPIA